jgi:hypothetical protein
LTLSATAGLHAFLPPSRPRRRGDVWPNEVFRTRWAATSQTVPDLCRNGENLRVAAEL